MPRNTRCFVLDETKHDISTVSRHGEIIFIFRENESRPAMWSDEFTDQIINKLIAHEFDPDKDYFVIVGKQVPLTMAVCALMEEYGGFRALFFYAPEQSYTAFELGNMHVHEAED